MDHQTLHVQALIKNVYSHVYFRLLLSSYILNRHTEMLLLKELSHRVIINSLRYALLITYKH